ncbi:MULTISPECIES: hypothetical protein [Alphaproteobacteria]|uniref:Uncharacterized protein n=2 Tax=Alphaproteobacteria TaxID=28211 RepID=A0A512HNZ1_9HYPH|nr:MULTISPECIES: hypothetical protein [Alphaproteobacteria]GEO87139.1 hypothetical protein RNA01_40710 [Ciceribacter naphthalenivorans]GLR23281.1 hypothetical protein GCM10007920_30700 [Ciceribacter naphthalenivorans]GLT06137.1 hypothetical protein GCM10007926_30700 [Sphingomonas psychrolutea]
MLIGRSTCTRTGKAATTLLAIALTAAGTLSPARAGPLADAAKEAEDKAAAGDVIGAFDQIRDAFGVFAMSLPLTVRKAVFVSEKPKAYGAYSPRPGAVFKPGEPLITYVELIGLAWKPLADGLQQASFSVDFEISEAGGKVLATQKSFGAFTFTSLVRNQEIFTHLTLDLTGAEPGEYLLKYTINDSVSKRFTSFEQPFTIGKK